MLIALKAASSVDVRSSKNQHSAVFVKIKTIFKCHLSLTALYVDCTNVLNADVKFSFVIVYTM